jgi:hypothetical protein
MRPLLLLTALVAGAVARAQGPADDVYPADITPPPGTQYPCALTALPRSLPGIPEGDRAYINRTYARILRATQTKLVALKALGEGRDVSGAVAHYLEQTTPLVERVRAEPAPAGLGPFQDDVAAALLLQQSFFRQGVEVREKGGSMADVYRIAEGRQASARLIAAWGKMSARYPAWSGETRDSIYHHLCALDLF